MTDPTNEQIREMLDRVMVDSPRAHTWDEVARRASRASEPFSTRPRTAVRLAVAACLIVLVSGLVVMLDSDSNTIRIDDDTVPTTSVDDVVTPEPTVTSTTTTTSTPTTVDGTSPETSAPPSPVPGAVGDGIGRPLTELAESDVIVATYIPDGMVMPGPPRTSDVEFRFELSTPVGVSHKGVWVRQSPALLIGGPDGAQPAAPDPATLTDPDHPPIEIAGITWGWQDFEQARVADLGRSVIYVGVNNLDEAEVESFLEGLRATSIDDFPGPVLNETDDGFSVTDEGATTTPDVVASDEEFALTALRVGDQVCAELKQTTTPTTMFFAVDCWDSQRVLKLGIIDTFAGEVTGTRNTPYLIIGVIDSVDAEGVRITSPTGNSIEVPTGPRTQAIDGRFFIANLELDDRDGLRYDRFLIEDST